jgi:hypothetical protein
MSCYQDDEDDELVEQLAILQLILLCVTALYILPGRGRSGSLIDERLAWDDDCGRHHQRGTLLRCLRMRKDSFEKLLHLLGEALGSQFITPYSGGTSNNYIRVLS